MTNDEISFDRVVKDDELRYLKQLLNKKQKQKKTKDRVKLKCAIYARKSQEDKKDLSLNAQINYCRAIIDSCDILELSNIYQEDDVSGMWDNRTEFQKMIQDVRDQVIDVIIVYKWHRFSRKVSDMENVITEDEIKASKDKVVVNFNDAICKLYTDQSNHIQVSIRAKAINIK